MDEQLEPYRQYTDEQRQTGGVIVPVGGSGEPVNSRGLMRPRDVREVERAKNADAVSAERSGTLCLDLHASRRDSLKAEPVNAPAGAADLLHNRVVMHTLQSGRRVSNVCRADCRVTEGAPAVKRFPAGAAVTAALESAPMDGMNLDTHRERYEASCALGETEKARWVRSPCPPRSKPTPSARMER